MIVSACSSSHPDLNDRFWESAASGYFWTSDRIAYFTWPDRLRPKMHYGYDDHTWVVIPIGHGLGALVDSLVVREMEEIQERFITIIGGVFYVFLISLFFSVIALFSGLVIGLAGVVAVAAVAVAMFYLFGWLLRRPFCKEFAKGNVGFVEIPEKFYQYLSGKQEVAQTIAKEKQTREVKKMIAGKVAGGIGGLLFGAAFPNAELFTKAFEFMAEKTAEQVADAVIKPKG